MSMGIPVICNSGVGDSDAIVKKYNSGLVIDSLDPASFGSLDMTERVYDEKEIRKGALDYFDLEKGIQAYSKAYKS